MEKKMRMGKRENWLSGKKQSKSGSVEASEGQVNGARPVTGGGGGQDNNEKNNNSG